MTTIEKLDIGDFLFEMESGESSMYKKFISPSDDFDVAVISSTSLCCEDPEKNIKNTLSLHGAKPKGDDIKKHCVVTGIDKHSKFRWTIFGMCVYSANRILINVFDVQFDK